MANANPVRFSLLPFDANSNLFKDVSDIPATTGPASLGLFVFDATSEALLGYASVPVSSMAAPQTTTPGVWNSPNKMSGGVYGQQGKTALYPLVLNVNAQPSGNGGYADFSSSLQEANATLNQFYISVGNVISTTQNYPASEVTIGGYSFFGASSTLPGSVLAPYLVGAEWKSGVTAVLLEFDDNGQVRPDLTTAAPTDAIYLFLFDTQTGQA